MSQENRFEEVGGASDNARWEPNKNMDKPNYPKSIMGYFIQSREQNGANGVFHVAVIHCMDKKDPKKLGEKVDVSLGKVLADKLAEITIGTFIKIDYKGKIQSKTGGRSYNDVAVFQDKGAVSYANLGGTVKASADPAKSTPTSNQNAATNNAGISQNDFNPDDLPF